VAFFLRSDSNLYASLRGRWIDFRYYDLMLPLDQAVRALNDFLPNILAGPPSLLGFLADAAERGELRIRPEKVISFAEVLEPQDRERLEQTFDQPLHQVYQCTEGLLAVTCPLGALHVQEDMVALQAGPLPGDPDRFTPVITDLWRRVQPMLRHRMNDVVAFDAGACKCGSAFRVLSRIEGRCDDVCYFDVDEGGVRPVFPDTVRRMVLLAAPEIRDYQVFQEGVGRLRIHLEPEPEADFGALERAVRESVARTLARYNCHARDLRIERGLEPVPARSKRRRVQRIG
jgi:putative adenylate-forming enzyme